MCADILQAVSSFNVFVRNSIYLAASLRVSIFVNLVESFTVLLLLLLMIFELVFESDENESDVLFKLVMRLLLAIKKSNGKQFCNATSASFSVCMRFLSRSFARTRRCLLTMKGITFKRAKSSLIFEFGEFIKSVSFCWIRSLLYRSLAHGLPRRFTEDVIDSDDLDSEKIMLNWETTFICLSVFSSKMILTLKFYLFT